MPAAPTDRRFALDTARSIGDNGVKICGTYLQARAGTDGRPVPACRASHRGAQWRKRHCRKRVAAVDQAPGRTLRETLDTLGMDQRELATRTGLSAKHVNLVIHGKAPITHATAIRLERVTGVPARMWNSLEAHYREELTRLEEKERLEEDLAWLKEIPTNELIKRGKVERQPEKTLLLREILGFFGVASVDAWKKVWSSPTAPFRKSPAFKAKPGSIATWLRLGELEVRDIECDPFNREKFRTVLDEIRGLTTKPPETFVPRMTALCAAAGVALCLVPEIRGAPASGAAQWLTPNKAMIQLSLRYKTNDQFWFSFFHEAGHILLDGKKEKFIDYGESNDERDRRADRFAANLLIPPRSASDLRALTRWNVIESFAESIGIAPGIVVGRLQREGVIGYNQCNGLKRRFRWARK